MAKTNYDKLKNKIGEEHKPFIVYDVETTGVMNGNDNHITQMSLVAYKYNENNNKYELQDQLFMLSKPDKEAIREIQNIEQEQKNNPGKAVISKAMDDFVYSLIKKAENDREKESIFNMGKIAKDMFSLEFTTVSGTVNYKLKLDDSMFSKYLSDYPDINKFCQTFKGYCFDHLSDKVSDVLYGLTVEEVLNKQGINLEKYIKDNIGLTNSEMQIGITEFLNKYATRNTVFVNNGTHFANHYMQKDDISLLGYTDNKENVIDLIQVQRSISGGNNIHWTADIDTFAKNYKAETGNEIKTFDALTKGLCLGEITAKAVGLSISLTSEKYLENKVKESAMSKDNDYVMSNARASAMNWVPASQHAFDIADYHFSSLEYVNFGNDRRYVDIDKMFEMNDNFEITLEGEKEPIKTWEELENKIKALNSEISDELLDKIHEKYEEITQTADKERKDYLINKYENMNKYEMKDLDLSALSKEDFEFLDKKYDLQHNYWAMAQRHKDVREEFVKAVENGDYEIIDLPNKQQAFRVMGLSDEHGTKSYHGVMDIEYGEILNDATIDIYDGINTDPIYSMSISFGDLDRLNAVLRNEHFDIIETKEEPKPLTEQEKVEALVEQYLTLKTEEDKLQESLKNQEDRIKKELDKYNKLANKFIPIVKDIYEKTGKKILSYAEEPYTKIAFSIEKGVYKTEFIFNNNQKNNGNIWCSVKFPAEEKSDLNLEKAYKDTTILDRLIKNDFTEESLTKAFWEEITKELEENIKDKTNNINTKQEKLKKIEETLENIEEDDYDL